VGGFLILIVIFGAVWLLFVLPARRRRASHSAMQETIVAGDDVITAGGIHGTVRELVDDLVHVEIAPDVVVQVDRRAIAAVARDVDVEVEPEVEPEVETDHGASVEPS
jgi:preprotein translocase subunit YajC